ncbi:ABC transporter ATP-binding protein [Rhodococcus sp. NPDC127593]|uniref:ABC transporter ATP-binding protein n=1 Tax=Rhodococcus sp. NPDC127593 TaxID=3345404 RepID=UPI00362676B5
MRRGDYCKVRAAQGHSRPVPVSPALRARKLDRSEIRSRTVEALKSVGLADAGGKYPWQLSGGMQQRVAIARAIATRPEILVMDEPFASVDARTRFELEDLTLALQHKYGMTVLLVTHDIDEAVYLAERVVVLSKNPCRVREIIDVDLGQNRDQITSRELPQFIEIRHRVMHLIRNS